MKTVTIFLFPLIAISLCHGHGFMHTPRSRGAYCKGQYTKSTIDIEGACDEGNKDYCPHCSNGGGKGAVMAALNGKFTPYRSDNRIRANMCGDAVGDNDHMVGGKFVPWDKAPIVAGYEPGSHIDFELQMDTHHNGFIIFYLCDLDACGTKDLQWKCFTEGHCKKLERVVVPKCEKNNDVNECGPVDPKYPARWYLPCRSPNKYLGGESGSMRYKLPADVKCEHCVIQMYWATANACNPKGFEQYFTNMNFPFGKSCGGDGGAVGSVRLGAEECGGKAFPEEFWSCSDVKVVKGASKMSLAQLQGNTPDHKDDDEDEDDDLPKSEPKKESEPTPESEPKPSTEQKLSKETPGPSAPAEHGNEQKPMKNDHKYEEHSYLKEKKGVATTTPEPEPTMHENAHSENKKREEHSHEHEHQSSATTENHTEAMMSPTQTPAPTNKSQIRLNGENEFEVNWAGQWYKLYCSPKFGVFVVKYEGEWRKVPGYKAPNDCHMSEAHLQS